MGVSERRRVDGEGGVPAARLRATRTTPRSQKFRHFIAARGRNFSYVTLDYITLEIARLFNITYITCQCFDAASDSTRRRSARQGSREDLTSSRAF